MGRVITLPGGQGTIVYDALSVAQREVVDARLAELHAAIRRNPLQGYTPFGRRGGGGGAQVGFLAAGRVKHKMAIAGNRAGKTDVGVVDDLIQCVDAACLPSWLARFKCWEPPFKLRVIVGGLSEVLYGVMIPKWRALTPADQLRGGGFDEAFDKTLRVLWFRNGSSVQFMSSDQDVEKFAGADLDRVHFDEEPPPPNGFAIFRENRKRLIDRAGQLMFTMTPLLGLTWTYDEVYLRRNEPRFHVEQWSMLDNPHLPEEEVAEEIAACRTEKERRAVIEGEFVHFRGRVLEQFDEDHDVVDPPARGLVQGLDVLIGYDPGVSRSGLVFAGFDRENGMLVFDELYLSNTPLVYIEHLPNGRARMRQHRAPERPSIVERVAEKCRWWGVHPAYWVIDPTARIRDLATARESVQSALLRAGVSVVPGQNDREAGILELQGRTESGGLRVSRACVSWLHEAERWLVAQDEEDGELRPKGAVKGSSFKTIGPDHLMDPTRYLAMHRVWGPGRVAGFEERGAWDPGVMAPVSEWRPPGESVAPMGFMS